MLEIRILLGLFLFILPGYLLSLLIFKKINFVERVLFGFVSGIFIFSALLLLFASFMRVSSLFFYAMYFIYLIIVLIFLFRRVKFEFKISKNLIMKLMILVPILIFVFYMTFFPHLKYDYYLPFHADEWVHWGLTRAFMENGRTSFINPFTGNGKVFDVELGFHVFLSSFKWLSGADLRSIFVLMPSIISVFVAIAAFCIGEKSKVKFGLASAFLISFIPTTIRYLGPSFLVPVSTGLLLTAFSIWLLNTEPKIKYAFFPILFIFSIFMHLPTAGAIAIVAIVYGILEITEKKFREGLALIGMCLFPFLLLYLLFPPFMSYLQLGLDAMFEESKQSLPLIRFSFDELTKIIWALFLFSAFLSVLKGKKMERSILLSFFLFFSIFFVYQKYKYGIQILSDRFLLFAYLMVTLLAGYGIVAIGEHLKNLLKKFIRKIPHRDAEKLFKAGIVTAILILVSIYAIPAHKDISFYRMIGERDFENFEWIRENIDKYKEENYSFDKAAIYPQKASIFSAVTGIYTIASSGWPIYGRNMVDKMSEFMEKRCKDSEFLEKNGIGVIYGFCENPYAEKIHDMTYLFHGVPPTADFYMNSTTPCKNQKIDFISNSSSPYSPITKILWNFGDGNTSTGETYALEFGENDYVETEIKMNKSFAIEMWLNPSFSYDDGITHRWFFWGDKDGYISCFKYKNGRIYFVVKVTKWRAAYSTIKYEKNTWHHFLASYNNGNFHLYWDGKLVKSSAGGNILPSVKKRLRIGGSFDGYIREVRIYDRYLKIDEVKQNYIGNVTMNGLIAWWKFNEGYGSIAYDSIGNHNGTIHGCKWIHHAVHAYKKAGTYNVTLTVWNEKGLKSEATKEIIIKDCAIARTNDFTDKN
ncbi:MAG: hypothetical protein FE036_00115 [Thermoplasmata archaeon]|nr:MAG: hypothetical protein FE036_00115 [Thermoplasmata archaeon]